MPDGESHPTDWLLAEIVPRTISNRSALPSGQIKYEI